MNKKNVMIAIAVAIFAVFAFKMNLNAKNSKLSDVFYENAETLDRGVKPLYTCWESVSGTVGSSLLTEVTYCLTCSTVPATSWNTPNVCQKN